MRLDWGIASAQAPADGRGSRWKERARGAVWAGALGLLAAVLAVQAERAGREGAVLARRSASLDRETERLRRSNQSLRDEIRALETDPVYVESFLRRWKMVGGGEKLIE